MSHGTGSVIFILKIFFKLCFSHFLSSISDRVDSWTYPSITPETLAGILAKLSDSASCSKVGASPQMRYRKIARVTSRIVFSSSCISSDILTFAVSSSYNINIKTLSENRVSPSAVVFWFSYFSCFFLTRHFFGFP